MLSGLQYTQRRVECLNRRWMAPCAVCTVLGRDLTPAALATLEIRHHQSGAPCVAADG